MLIQLLNILNFLFRLIIAQFQGQMKLINQFIGTDLCVHYAIQDLQTDILDLLDKCSAITVEDSESENSESENS